MSVKYADGAGNCHWIFTESYKISFTHWIGAVLCCCIVSLLTSVNKRSGGGVVFLHLATQMRKAVIITIGKFKN
jgi:hypothetical protein